MKRTRLDRRTKVAGVIAAALLLSCCLLAGCGQEKTETTTDALDTMENQAGDVSISLGMDQTAVEKSLSTGTQLDATEDPQMETISYGEGTDYLVVIYQEGKVISLGTYWEDLEDLTANTRIPNGKPQRVSPVVRRWRTYRKLTPTESTWPRIHLQRMATSRLRIFSRQRERPAA